jgi:hypothetical protein
VSTKLAELLSAAGGGPIDWSGQRVHMMYELPQREADQELLITFGQPSPARPQGLRIKVRGGLVELNGEALDDVVLWSDTAPETVLLRFVPAKAKGPMTVRFWNAWRDTSGTMQAWIGNAGMLVETQDDGTTVLRCSDGFDEPSFDDLVAVLNPRSS